MEICRADPRVEPDPLEDRADVGARPLGQAGHLVGERDLEGEERVRPVLDQLGLLEGDPPERPAERPEHLDQDRLRVAVRVRRPPDHDARRMCEIGERRPLAQELGDREEARLVGDVAVAQQALRGPDRHRAADDDDRRRIEPGDVGQDRLDGTDVGVPVVVDRRPDADEDDLGRRLRGVIEDGQRA